MALVLNTYKDYEMKTIDKQYGIGVAGITGYYADKSHWIEYSYQAQQGNVYFVQANTTNFAGVVLSGGNSIFDYSFRSTIPFQDTVPTDTMTNSSTALIYNPTLIGKGENNAYFLQMWCSQNSDTTASNLFFTARLGLYTQTPTEGQRTTWNYNLNSWHPERSIQIPNNTQFGCVKFYKCTIWETDYYLLAAGISAGGQCSPSGQTMLMLIPTAYWEDKEVKPYVGPVTPESAAGFDPSGRDFYNDSIAPRDSFSKNPFGFNNTDIETGGIWLIGQSSAQFQALLQGVYLGSTVAGGITDVILNPGNNRKVEEVQVMTQGILSCKLMPAFGIVSGTPCIVHTICGYPLGGDLISRVIQAGGPTGFLINQIQPITAVSALVTRTYNNFLDFEPYTSMTLHIPFVGDVSMDPSVVYGALIRVSGYADYFTGLISIVVEVVKDGNSYIYTTMQGNCAVEMPIIGAGSSTTSTVGKIASGITSLVSNPINGVFSMTQGLAEAGKSVPVTKNAQTNMAPYFSQRHVYLTIDTPLPENPSNYAELMGTVVRKEGTVGRYTGYSEFSAVNLNTVNATDAEKQEIERLLKEGVFV